MKEYITIYKVSIKETCMNYLSLGNRALAILLTIKYNYSNKGFIYDIDTVFDNSKLILIQTISKAFQSQLY